MCSIIFYTNVSLKNPSASPALAILVHHLLSTKTLQLEFNKKNYFKMDTNPTSLTFDYKLQ